MLLLLALACPADPVPVELSPAVLGSVCVTLETEGGFLAEDADRYAFSADQGEALALRLHPTDLGMVLLYDQGRYLVHEGDGVSAVESLDSDVTLIEDGYISPGEWLLHLEVDETGSEGATYRLENRATGFWLAEDGGMVATRWDAARFTLSQAEGCVDFPELSLDATGTVSRTTWDDGTLYGMADSHSHLMSNFSFGGGGLFHGGAYHRYGVEHALPDCDFVHGDEGRKDLFGYSYDNGGDFDAVELVGTLSAGELDEFNHATEGYPEFTEWPNSRKRATHQTQYHRWLERAWMGGLRLIVQHATSDETICKLTVGTGFQRARYDCTDMTAVDRIIDETWQMQRTIDALHGGEGEGWFRVVESPEQAREVIEEGKLAVVLGIETSNLFRCYLTPREGDPSCDEDYVDAQLDEYYERGVRALFPVHKYDNRFSPGDGSRGFIEAGAFINSGHWTNKTEDCPSEELQLPGMFDGNSLSFTGLNEPREEYLSEAPNDLSEFAEDPLETLLPYGAYLLEGGAEGEWCQKATITPIGEHLLEGMMARGMIIEVDHFPQWAYVDAYALLQGHDYPAAGTHGRHWEGEIYALGGVASGGPSRCHDPDTPGQSTAGIAERVELIEAAGGYPGVVWSFDFNGFAGGPGPRFGDEGCGENQPNELAYPFTSFAGDVTFTEPWLGNRPVDFNTEGMIHIGLLPELVEDLRADAVDESELNPLFRGAEAWIRMWEKAERRAAEM